jgi:OOP family OmpA-OmpF porin
MPPPRRSFNMFKLYKSKIAAALLGAAFLGAGLAPAAAQPAPTQAASTGTMAAQAGSTPGKIFGAPYSAVQNVVPQQSQVVYYRSVNHAGQAKSAANVYVDGEFQMALLPNGYTVFCVPAGMHTLGAYLNEAPLYKGKTTDRFQANLQGGKTYFLKVREDGNGEPQAIAGDVAERELAGTRMQVHALPRASAVQACQAAPVQPAAAAPAFKDYTLDGDVLFAFGKSGYRDIHPAGREAIGRLVAQMRAENAISQHILVIGHADQIGSDAAAEELGAQRAATVRRILIERGIPASRIEAESVGNREPVVEDCRGSRQQVVACYAPNRRVVVRAQMSSPN